MLEYLDDNEDFRHFAAEFLSSVGTGIGGLNVEQTEISADKLPKPVVESLQSENEVEAVAVPFGPGMSLHFKADDP